MLKRLLVLGMVVMFCAGCGSSSRGNNDAPEKTESDAIFEGAWEVEGEGGEDYTATLTVSKQAGDCYLLRWDSDGESREGDGYKFGEYLCVECPSGEGTFGLYKKDGDKITGIFTTLENPRILTERSKGASRLAPSRRDLSGSWSVRNTSDGDRYTWTDTLNVVRRGQTYIATWGPVDEPVLSGAGLGYDDILIVGAGVGGGITVKMFKVIGSGLEGRFFYTEYDEETGEVNFVTGKEKAVRE